MDLVAFTVESDMSRTVCQTLTCDPMTCASPHGPFALTVCSGANKKVTCVVLLLGSLLLSLRCPEL